MLCHSSNVSDTKNCLIYLTFVCLVTQIYSNRNDEIMNQTKQENGGEGVDSASRKYREVSLKRHMTVRIPRGMAEAVEGFLKTEQAAKMGFDSKADVVTAAIRKMLTEYGYYQTQRREVKKARA